MPINHFNTLHTYKFVFVIVRISYLTCNLVRCILFFFCHHSKAPGTELPSCFLGLGDLLLMEACSDA